MNPLAELFRYNRWANEQIIAACRPLTDAQLDAPIAGADARPIRVQLMHVIGGQQTMVLRTMGRQHEGELNARGPWPGFAEIERIAATSSDDLVSIAQSMTADDEVVLPFMGKRPRFPKSFFLAHAAMHGTEHRTVMASALAALGMAPPDLDGWAYAAAAGYGEE